jgi:hypothetical protein
VALAGAALVVALAGALTAPVLTAPVLTASVLVPLAVAALALTEAVELLGAVPFFSLVVLEVGLTALFTVSLVVAVAAITSPSVVDSPLRPVHAVHDPGGLGVDVAKR